jgi:ribonuclease HI|tara:strand:+ start:2803 stop:3264 length:462 start_codon:yes stop_codon:yes gene_type:complete
MKKIKIYTDGSSIGNPGPGGYGIILYWEGKIRELTGGYRKTTNNRMELLAVIIGLESLRYKPSNVTIFSDSKYVIDSIEKKWVFNWEKKNFKGKKNHDLWKRLLEIYREHEIKFRWIKGHNNHPQNERCDFLALQSAKGSSLSIDEFYEKNIK